MNLKAKIFVPFRYEGCSPKNKVVREPFESLSTASLRIQSAMERAPS